MVTFPENAQVKPQETVPVAMMEMCLQDQQQAQNLSVAVILHFLCQLLISSTLTVTWIMYLKDTGIEKVSKSFEPQTASQTPLLVALLPSVTQLHFHLLGFVKKSCKMIKCGEPLVFIPTMPSITTINLKRGSLNALHTQKR